jgi:hypothetical protein
LEQSSFQIWWHQLRSTCWGVENSLMIVISVHSLQCLQCCANVVWLLSLQLGVPVIWPVICQLSRNYIQLRRMPNHPPAVTSIGATATNSNSWGGLGGVPSWNRPCSRELVFSWPRPQRQTRHTCAAEKRNTRKRTTT